MFGPKHTITSPNGVHQIAINGPGHCCYQIVPGNNIVFQVSKAIN